MNDRTTGLVLERHVHQLISQKRRELPRMSNGCRVVLGFTNTENLSYYLLTAATQFCSYTCFSDYNLIIYNMTKLGTNH